MNKVSVLTAVYNAEKYLRECLDSLTNQTLVDCQFICIDDCSTDSSLSILKEYANKDSRFLILQTTTNSGQAIARNEGLRYVEGEYIAMLDADDWYSDDTLEKAYNSLSESGADVVVMKLMQCYDDGSVEEYLIKSDKDEWSGEEAFVLSLDWSLHGVYVVKADIHKEYPFDTTCRLYSDDNTTRTHFLHSKKVVRSDSEYFYRKHSDSMTNACSVRRFDYLLANLSMKQQLDMAVMNNELSSPEKVLCLYEKARLFNIIGCFHYFLDNEDHFTKEEKTEIKVVFSKVLPTIEKRHLPIGLILRPGYYPFHSYALFASVERMYRKIRNLFR